MVDVSSLPEAAQQLIAQDAGGCAEQVASYRLSRTPPPAQEDTTACPGVDPLRKSSRRTTMTVSTNRRAARGVALHDPDPDLHQRKIILDMLGLISSAEIHMPPILEPTRHDMRSETINEAVQSIENQPTTGSAPKADAPMRDRSTVPEGLRNYKPDAPPPAEPKVRENSSDRPGEVRHTQWPRRAQQAQPDAHRIRPPRGSLV
jgi:hypothetical protein